MKKEREYFSGIYCLLIILTLMSFNRGVAQTPPPPVDIFNDHHIIGDTACGY